MTGVLCRSHHPCCCEAGIIVLQGLCVFKSTVLLGF